VVTVTFGTSSVAVVPELPRIGLFHHPPEQLNVVVGRQVAVDDFVQAVMRYTEAYHYDLFCHGSDGKGETKMGKKYGAKDYTDPKVQEALKDDAAFKATKEGLKDKEGNPVRWIIEWGAAGQLAQQGVNVGSLKIGDKVVATGSPGRNAEDHRLRLRTITRPSDGWKWPVGNQTFN